MGDVDGVAVYSFISTEGGGVLAAIYFVIVWRSQEWCWYWMQVYI